MDIKDLVLSSLHELENDVAKELEKEKDDKEAKESEKEQNNKINIEKRDISNKIEIEEDIKITKDGKTVELKEKIRENDKGELEVESIETSQINLSDDKEFLLNLRERLLVLFEGLKSSNNKKLEAKVDLILNFFEYLLATIEDKIEKK